VGGLRLLGLVRRWLVPGLRRLVRWWRCGGRTWRRGIGGMHAGGGWRRAGVAAGAVEHEQIADLDLGGVAIGTALILPLAGAELAGDKDARALAQVLLGDLGKPAPEYTAMPFGALARLAAGAIGPGLVGV
jgi:hypothetical protein